MRYYVIEVTDETFDESILENEESVRMYWETTKEDAFKCIDIT